MTYFSVTLSLLTTGPALPTRLYGHAALSDGEKVYIMGGYEGTSCTSAKGYSRAVYE